MLLLLLSFSLFVRWLYLAKSSFCQVSTHPLMYYLNYLSICTPVSSECLNKADQINTQSTSAPHCLSLVLKSILPTASSTIIALFKIDCMEGHGDKIHEFMMLESILC